MFAPQVSLQYAAAGQSRCIGDAGTIGVCATADEAKAMGGADYREVKQMRLTFEGIRMQQENATSPATNDCIDANYIRSNISNRIPSFFGANCSFK